MPITDLHKLLGKDNDPNTVRTGYSRLALGLTGARQAPHSFLFHSLEYTSEATTAQTQAKIEAVKQRLIDINAEIMEKQQQIGHAGCNYEDIRVELVQLALLRSDLDDDLIEFQSILGPWHPSRIPFDILALIFVYASKNLPEWVPWTLMAVCRAWRRAAIACTSLWSTLNITDHPILSPKKCWGSSYKGLTLTTPVAVRKAIRRSRGGPLNVHLAGGGYGGFCRHCFEQCLDQAGRQIDRWKSLMFDIRVGGPSPVNIGPILSGPLPNLHSVSIICYSSDLIAALSARASRLHTIKFVGSAPDSVALSVGHKLWPRIHKLKFGYSWFMSGRSIHYLSSLLAACTTLHSLELDETITGTTHFFRLPNAWPPDIPKLTRVTCYVRATALALLSGMTITVLYISVLFPPYRDPDWDVSDWDPSGSSKIYLPNLKHLTCHELPTTLLAVGLFDAPSIVDLVMVGLYSRSPIFTYAKDLEKALKHSSLRPRNVSLHWRAQLTDRDPLDLLLFLRYLPDIRCLTLHGNLPRYAKTVAQPQAQKMCPKLEYIAWYFLSDKGDVEWLQNSFYNTARNGFGGPQTKWTVECLSKVEEDRTFFNVRMLVSM
jgi:hypothetical protein